MLIVTIVDYNGRLMDVRSLQVFLSVATHLNYTRAGEELNLSQPSVSVRIRLLENEVNMKLFEQLGKKIALTNAGQQLVPYARAVLTALDNAHQAISELQGLEKGTLRIGASTTPGMYLIPHTVARFKKQHPLIEIQLQIRDTRGIEDAVIKNEFDFGFVGAQPVGAEVAVVPWMTDEILLVVPPTHHLAKKKSIKVRDLKEEKFISRGVGSATQATTLSHLNKANLEIDTVIELQNPESVKKAVQSGLGLAFISRFAVATELKAKTLVAVRVAGLDIKRELKIVYRKDKHLSKAARSFIEMAKDQIR